MRSSALILDEGERGGVQRLGALEELDPAKPTGQDTTPLVKQPDKMKGRGGSLDNEEVSGDGRADLADELSRGLRAPTGRDEVVDDEDGLPSLDRAFLHLEHVLSFAHAVSLEALGTSAMRNPGKTHHAVLLLVLEDQKSVWSAHPLPCLTVLNRQRTSADTSFPGSFPCFRTGTNAAPSLRARIGPRRNPLETKKAKDVSSLYHPPSEPRGPAHGRVFLPSVPHPIPSSTGLQKKNPNAPSIQPNNDIDLLADRPQLGNDFRKHVLHERREELLKRDGVAEDWEDVEEDDGLLGEPGVDTEEGLEVGNGRDRHGGCGWGLRAAHASARAFFRF